MTLILHLLTRYYSRGGTKSIPFQSAIGAILLLALINALTLAKFLDLDLFGYMQEDAHWVKYFKVGLYFLPGYLLFNLIFNKEQILSRVYSHRTIVLATIMLICYLVTSIILMVITMNYD